MRLPGGHLCGGTLRRDVVFKCVTGEFELTLLEMGHDATNLPLPAPLADRFDFG